MYNVPQVSFYVMVDHGVYLRASFDGYDICSEYTQYYTYSSWVFLLFSVNVIQVWRDIPCRGRWQL